MFLDMDERVIKDTEYELLKYCKLHYEACIKAGLWLHDDPAIANRLLPGDLMLEQSLPIIKVELERLRAHYKHYVELLDAVYGERPEGENERPAAVDVVRLLHDRSQLLSKYQGDGFQQ